MISWIVDSGSQSEVYNCPCVGTCIYNYQLFSYGEATPTTINYQLINFAFWTYTRSSNSVELTLYCWGHAIYNAPCRFSILGVGWLFGEWTNFWARSRFVLLPLQTLGEAAMVVAALSEGNQASIDLVTWADYWDSWADSILGFVGRIGWFILSGNRAVSWSQDVYRTAVNWDRSAFDRVQSTRLYRDLLWIRIGCDEPLF